MSVKRCQREIDSAEFSEWVAFNQSEQFTVNRVEYMLAQLSAITINIHSKNQKFKAEDFMLSDKSKKSQSPEQMEKTLAAIYGSY